MHTYESFFVHWKIRGRGDGEIRKQIKLPPDSNYLVWLQRADQAEERAETPLDAGKGITGTPQSPFGSRGRRIRGERRRRSRGAVFLLDRERRVGDLWEWKHDGFPPAAKPTARFLPRASSNEFTITVLTFNVPGASLESKHWVVTFSGKSSLSSRGLFLCLKVVPEEVLPTALCWLFRVNKTQTVFMAGCHKR